MKTASYLSLTVAIALLCACSDADVPANAPAPVSSVAKSASSAAPSVYADPQYGFSLALPADMTLRHDFQRSYLDDASWKAYAGPHSRGTPVVALVLDGSNQITAAELRIGVGTTDDAVAHCLDVPASGAASAVEQTTLAGVPVTHFHAADAAMSHYMDVQSYRVVHAGRCYAIDLMLSGTRPEVYDPPATPPFTRADAKQRLRTALDGFRFLP